MARSYLTLKGANMVCSSNSPKLAKIEAVQRIATDAHGVSTIANDLAFHVKRSV
jgi:hypothetical protein